MIRGELLTASAASSLEPAAASPVAGKRATGPGGTHVGGTTNRHWGVFIGVAAVLALFLFGAGSERRPRVNFGGKS